ncbi:MAG: polysaccharide deacetylase family protein [Motiliproteus sp.]
MLDPWQQLAGELQRWRDLDRTATLWWRDDDARQATPELEQLCTLSRDFSIPLSLAVIPDGADASLLPLFDNTPQLRALLHGYRHISHAETGKRNCELGDDRPLAEMLAELESGQQQLTQLLGHRFVAVLVPPWNRLSSALVEQLSQIGCLGLSTLGPRAAAVHKGLRVNNVHIDLVNWKQGRCFAGDKTVLQQLIDHLQQRRSGLVDAVEATGLMSHHLAHDPQCWDFCTRLFEFLADQPVQWLTAEQVFLPDLG